MAQIFISIQCYRDLSIRPNVRRVSMACSVGCILAWGLLQKKKTSGLSQNLKIVLSIVDSEIRTYLLMR